MNARWQMILKPADPIRLNLQTQPTITTSTPPTPNHANHEGGKCFNPIETPHPLFLFPCWLTCPGLDLYSVTCATKGPYMHSHVFFLLSISTEYSTDYRGHLMQCNTNNNLTLSFSWSFYLVTRYGVVYMLFNRPREVR